MKSLEILAASVMLLLASSTVLAQDDGDDDEFLPFLSASLGWEDELNRIVPIRTCNDVTCTDQSSLSAGGPCYESDDYTVGVGIYPDAINITSDTNLTLTLINGASEAATWERADLEKGSDRFAITNDIVDHELYVGAPAGFDLHEANPGCALMLFSRGQTIDLGTRPSWLSEDAADNEFASWESLDGARALANNTSGCGRFQTRVTMARWTREFRYGEGGNSSLPRCQSLAAYVEGRIRENLRWFHRGLNGFTVDVVGGAFSDPTLLADRAG